MTNPDRKKLLKRAKNIIKNKIQKDKDGRRYVVVNGKKFYPDDKLSERELIYKILKLFLKKRKRKGAPKAKKEGKPPENTGVGYSKEVADKFATYDLLEKMRESAKIPKIEGKKDKAKNTKLLEGYVENDRWKGKYLEEDTGFVKPEYQGRIRITKRNSSRG